MKTLSTSSASAETSQKMSQNPEILKLVQGTEGLKKNSREYQEIVKNNIIQKIKENPEAAKARVRRVIQEKVGKNLERKGEMLHESAENVDTKKNKKELQEKNKYFTNKEGHLEKKGFFRRAKDTVGSYVKSGMKAGATIGLILAAALGLPLVLTAGLAASSGLALLAFVPLFLIAGLVEGAIDGALIGWIIGLINKDKDKSK